MSLHYDFETIKNDATGGALFVKLAYQQNDLKMEKILQQLPPGYEMVIMTDHLGDTNQHEYRCVVLLNHNEKEIIFANAGTRPDFTANFASDLVDDFLLMIQHQPLKSHPAATLNSMILDSLGEQAKDYNFYYTGHSLGAAIAQIAAADMDIELRERDLKRAGDNKQIFSVTFENPGAKAIINDIYHEAGQHFDKNTDGSFVVINNRDNVINMSNAQFGEIYHIMPDNQDPIFDNPFSSAFFYLSNIFDKMGTNIAASVFNLLSTGDDLEQDHALNNFIKVLKNGSGIVYHENDDHIIDFGKITHGRVEEIKESVKELHKMQQVEEISQKVADEVVHTVYHIVETCDDAIHSCLQEAGQDISAAVNYYKEAVSELCADSDITEVRDNMQHIVEEYGANPVNNIIEV